MDWLIRHLTDIHHLQLVAALTSGWVAVNYLVIGGMLIPSLAAPWRVTRNGALFFIGCALTHVMIIMTVYMFMHAGSMAKESVVSMLYGMIVLHLMQIIGGLGFVRDIINARMVLKVEP